MAQPLGVSATQITPPKNAIKTAIDMISSYLSIYLSIDPVLVALIPFGSDPEIYCF